MKVLEIKSRRIVDVNDSYGARLIEQGRAVLAPAPAKKEKPREAQREAQKEAPRKRGDA